MIPEAVVLDTNALVGEWHLQSGPLRALLVEAKSGNISLAIPEVVVLETVNKYKETLEEVEAAFRKAQRQLRDLRVPLGTPSVDVSGLASTYEAMLRTVLAENSSYFIDIPPVPHEDLIRRALSRRRPFKASGAGYRDALIWESVASLARLRPVALVSDNWRDFAESKQDITKLSQDLMADFDPWTGQVALYDSVRRYLEKRVRPLYEVVDTVRAKLDGDEQFRRDVEEQIRDVTDAWEFDGDELSDDGTVRYGVLNDILSFVSVRVDKAFHYGDGAFYLPMRVVATALVDEEQFTDSDSDDTVTQETESRVTFHLSAVFEGDVLTIDP